MNQRFLMWGLASIVFVVTLGVSSWHEGLWPADEPVVATHRTRPAVAESNDVTPMPARPFGPEKPAAAVVPVIAAVTPQPPPPPPAETPPPADIPPMATTVPDMDEAEFRERAAAHHGPREH